MLTPAEERQLVQRLYARDETALDLFYTHYRQALYHTIWRLVRHDELAEDILQDSLLKFWLAFPTYDSRKGRLFTWALNICRHVAIDRLREQRRSAGTYSLSEELTGQLPAPTSFRPEHIGVRDWLLLLAPPDRELLDLLYLQGYTQVEAAEKMRLTLGTIKSRVRRIITSLAQAMRPVSPVGPAPATRQARPRLPRAVARAKQA